MNKKFKKMELFIDFLKFNFLFIFSKSEFSIHFSKVNFLFIFFELFIYFFVPTPCLANYGM